MRERSNGKHKTTGSLRTEITAIVLWSWSICVKYYCISSNQFMSRAGLPSLLLSVTAGHARNELEVRSPVTVPSWVTQSHKRARSHRASQWLTKHHSSAIQRCVRVDSCVVHSCLCPFTCRISLLNDCRMHWLNRCTVLSSTADDSYPTSCWLPLPVFFDSCTNSCDSMDMLRTSLWILPGSQCRCCPTVMSGETSRPQFKHSWHAWHKLKHKSEFLLGALSRARGLHMREKDGSTLYTILYWISENSTSIWSMYPFVFCPEEGKQRIMMQMSKVFYDYRHIHKRNTTLLDLPVSAQPRSIRWTHSHGDIEHSRVKKGREQEAWNVIEATTRNTWQRNQKAMGKAT